MKQSKSSRTNGWEIMRLQEDHHLPCKSISNGKTTYFGTVSDGFTASEVHKGAAKLVSLLGMAGSFVGPKIAKMVAE